MPKTHPKTLRRILGILVIATFLGSFGFHTLTGQGPTNKPPSESGPLSPQQEQKTFHLVPGLRIELVACEPQIESPVAMAFDEDGRLWVVEMRDYPNGPPPGKPGTSRIRLLEDKNGDGHYEHSSIFADKLLFANGAMPWKGGLLVTAAPHILYLKDTNGDGLADHREVLFEGFAAQNPQLRVSHPNLGIDNWIYVANGLRGGTVERSGAPKAQEINISGKDFRFDLINNRYEAISGLGQYGNTFDDWGRRFVCDNRHHLRHVVLPDHYLKGNPYLAVSAVMEDISVLEGGMLNSGGKIYPLSENWTTSNLHAGRFTAACGVFIYRGDLLPREFQGNAFTCDPTGNLVHREILQQKGATFQSKPARKGVEFLATPHNWCRPVFLTHGPEGALYIVDMYRAVIEHPQFMPPELKTRPDLTLGKEKGRIWRIVPEDYEYKPIRPQLSQAGNEELVKLLTHPNAWWCTTAQRLLWERQDQSVSGSLRKLCKNSKGPRARLHAAWLLEGLGTLKEADLLRLLSDDHPRIREHAVLLAEKRLASSAPLRQKVLALASDDDSQVRFQVALTLGMIKGEAKVPPLAQIALAGVDDTWTRTAVASAVPEQAGALLAHLLQTKDFLTKRTSGRIALLQELTQLVGSRRNQDEVAQVLEALLSLNSPEKGYWQMVALDGLAEGMRRRGTQLTSFLNKLPSSQKTLVASSLVLLDHSAKVAQDNSQDLADRLIAIRLLAHVSWEKAHPILTELINGDSKQEIKLAAIRALAGQRSPQVAPLLVSSWSSYTPALRREAIEALTRSPERIRVFLKEVEAKRIKPSEIDPARTRYLMSYRVADIRNLSRKLLKKSVPADRFQAIVKYQKALERKGNPYRGRIIFQMNCATCHRIGELGVDVGPVISDTRTRTKEALLTDILNPNQAIDNNYVNYLITTRQGKVFSGIIVSETASSITLKRAENQTDVILREDIDEILSTGVSLMPEGLEKNINVQQMADLLTFLKNWRYLDGTVPGFED